MPDIKKQFSLDYLIPSGTRDTTSAEVGGWALDEAVILFSQPILQLLKNAPDEEMRAHDLAKELSKRQARPFDFASFIEVVNHLERLGFVRIVEKDVTGNHLIRLLRTQ